MRISAFTVGLAAASSALAGPLRKRVMETVTEIETVYTTVTVDESAIPTFDATPEPTTVVVVETTTEPPAQTPVEPPVETPVEPPVETPVEPPVEEPVEAETVDTKNQPTIEEPSTPSPVTPEPEPVVEQPTTPEPVVEPTPAPVEQPTQGSSSGSSFIDTSLDHHNIHRANHSAPALTWNSDLASYAAVTGATCNFAHDTATGSETGSYGQNIAMWASSNDIRETGEDAFIARTITEMWYNGEINLYPANDYGKPNPDQSNFHAWGHYSQVVWVDTSSVGCHVQYCAPGTMSSMGAYFSVCNYRSAGNVGGQYGDNVLPPLGHATVNA